MTKTIIQQRLNDYAPRSKQEEINALKEIYQEIALSGLARTDFFKIAAFQGGTCLRIVHQLRRFSEDLDFVLIKPLASFKWATFLKAIELEFLSFGIDLKIKERSEAQGTIRKAFLKENSFGKILELTYDRLPSDEQTITIKLEIDTSPPEDSIFEPAFLNFPYPFSILVQDLPSLFASKCHALLCRKYIKGRDWFDFLWYVSKRVAVNYLLLQRALNQAGPYQEKSIFPDKKWLVKELGGKIASIDWQTAREDVNNFLTPEDRKFTENWSLAFFDSQLHKLLE